MRRFIVITVSLVALFLSATATAGSGNGNPCKDFATAQTGDGQQIFDSRRLCQKYPGELFTPALTIAPGHVNAGETFTLNASGFHASASVVVYFYIAGQSDPYGSYAPALGTSSSGTISIPFAFVQCGNSPDNLTILLTDSFGVHAYAPLVLC